MQYQERSCARQKLDKTDTECCTGIDELGRLVWHAVADGAWQMVVLELKLTKKVTADKEGTEPPLPRIVVEPRRFCVLSADIEAHGKPKAALRFRRQKHVDKITVFVDSDFAGDPFSRKSTTGLVAQIGNHTEIWINASELDSSERWRSGVLRSSERRSSWIIPKIFVPRSGNSNED